MDNKQRAIQKLINDERRDAYKRVKEDAYRRRREMFPGKDDGARMTRDLRKQIVGKKEASESLNPQPGDRDIHELIAYEEEHLDAYLDELQRLLDQIDSGEHVTAHESEGRQNAIEKLIEQILDEIAALMGKLEVLDKITAPQSMKLQLSILDTDDSEVFRATFNIGADSEMITNGQTVSSEAKPTSSP